MVATVQLEKRVVDASIFRIIISKFCHRQKLGLIILFKIDRSSKVDFNDAVLAFGLAIRL